VKVAQKAGKSAGPDPDGFLDFFARELAAPMRALTPAEKSPGQ
jgi:hypothetical protein